MFSLVPVLPKVLYFLFYLMLGLSSPFYALIVSGRVHHDERIVGFTMGSMFLLQLLFAPFWGFIADVTGRPRLVICVLLVSSLSVRAVVFFLPSDVPWFVVPLLFVGSEAVFCGVVPVIDGLACQLLEGKPFGHQRLFGAISWGLAAPMAGVFFAHVPWNLEACLLMTVIGSLFVVACLFFASASTSSTDTRKDRVPFMTALRQTKLSWQQICFFVVLVFAGFSSSSIGTFLFLFLDQG